MTRAFLGLTAVGLLMGAVGADARGASAPAQPAIAVLDLHPGAGSSSPRYVTALGDRAVFGADDGTHGRELWVSDGTSRGTRMLHDIRPGPEGSDPSPGGEVESEPVPPDARRRFTRVGDTLYFVADDGLHGREVWATDGTAAGTRMLADVTEGGEAWGIAAYLTAHDGALYFVGDDGFDGEELWASDGTAAGTRQVADIMDGPAGSLPGHLASTPLGLAFAAEHPDHGVEPWISDGTAGGTTLLGDLVPGLDGSEPSSFVGVGDEVLFAASDLAFAANLEPWITDGSQGGTRMLIDLNPGGRGFNLGYVRHRGRLYFGGNDGASGSEVWATDGTREGTHRVADIAAAGRGASPTAFASFGDLLFFQAFHFRYGIEPWLTDGTESGTRLLADVNPGEVASSWPAEASALGGRLYFAAERADSGRELWMTDGTAAGTRIVADLVVGPQGADPTALLASAGRLYFAAAGDRGVELHVLGGETPSTPEPTPPGPAPTPTAGSTAAPPDVTRTPPAAVIHLPRAERAGAP